MRGPWAGVAAHCGQAGLGSPSLFLGTGVTLSSLGSGGARSAAPILAFTQPREEALGLSRQEVPEAKMLPCRWKNMGTWTLPLAPVLEGTPFLQRGSLSPRTEEERGEGRQDQCPEASPRSESRGRNRGRLERLSSQGATSGVQCRRHSKWAVSDGPLGGGEFCTHTPLGGGLLSVWPVPSPGSCGHFPMVLPLLAPQGPPSTLPLESPKDQQRPWVCSSSSSIWGPWPSPPRAVFAGSAGPGGPQPRGLHLRPRPPSFP